ncbi:molecular chaperone DnaJ, partial [Escherichia coli]|nr:molecular chaperone DnaJ [Escherichia coli]
TTETSICPHCGGVGEVDDEEEDEYEDDDEEDWDEEKD